LNEEKVFDALLMLSPAFERLRYPKLRRAMSGRVSVEQAARIARIPLTEMLYVLNLTLGEPEEALAEELLSSDRKDFEYADENLPVKPAELAALEDDAAVFVDLMPLNEAHLDPMPAIAKGLTKLKKAGDVLLIRHSFDPVPLRDLYLRRYKLASWAEERKPGEWFIYFYRPAARAGAAAHPPVFNEIYLRAAAASAG
jgi:hypothetical protein